MKIAVCMKYWGVGGAENGYRRLAEQLPEHQWDFITEITKPYDAVIYSNSHDFYEQAIKHDVKKIIQRTTGKRSFNLPKPPNLHALVCSSREAYDLFEHSRKTLIYNFVQIPVNLKPIPCDLLYSPARIGVGQCVDVAINYAIKNQRHITVLGGRQHLHENTYHNLKRKYSMVNWTGVVSPAVALRYMAGCKDYLVSTPNHGVSNAVIEAVVLGKRVINLGGVEIPTRENIDVNKNVEKWRRILK